MLETILRLLLEFTFRLIKWLYRQAHTNNDPVYPEAYCNGSYETEEELARRLQKTHSQLHEKNT